MNSFTPEQVAALKAPLHLAHVKTRAQAGRNLSYVEAWHAIAEANRIFGFDGWTRETVELRLLGEPRLTGDKWRVGYAAKVRITVWAGDREIVREGCGFGSGIDKDVDQAHESALKEAESDAMKRGLMTFGNPFGLALYDKAQAQVTSGPATDDGPAASPEPVINLDAEMDACKTKAALLAWEQFRLKEIGRLSKADGAPLAAKFSRLLASLPEKATDDLRADDLEFAA